MNGSVEESDAMEWRNTNTCATCASVSCIQIYRDNLRPSMKTMLGRARLELLFHSGCGTYCYFNCPAFDIVLPIRVEVNGSVEYIPVVISVKACVQMNWSEIQECLEAMGTNLRQGTV